MRIEACLVAFLTADRGVRGALKGGRIWKGRAQSDAAYPRLHYWVVSDVPDQSLAGACREHTATLRWEAVGCGESGYEDASAVMDAVRTATAGGAKELQSWNAADGGWMPPLAPEDAQLQVQSVRVVDRQAGDEEQPVEFGAKSIFIVAVDLVVAYVAED